MRFYDWLILILIGALTAGAYFLGQAGAFADQANLPAWMPSDWPALVGVTLGALAPAALGFVIYLIAFRGAAAPLRPTGAATLLLFLIGVGLSLFARHLLFTGWLDDGGTQGREDLMSLADWFSGGIRQLAAAAFGLMLVLAILRRLRAPQAEL